MMKLFMRKNAGNVGQLMSTGLCMLALTVITMAYFNCIELVQQKTQAGQLARKYILKMETVGYLTEEEQTSLVVELEALGITEINLENSTTAPEGYGQPIELDIRGKLNGEYAFREHRVSTAKY
jgi:hypothetical protein